MDRELDNTIIIKERIFSSLRIIIFIVIIIAGLISLKYLLSTELKQSRLRTAIAENGSIADAISATGIILPEFEHILTSPIRTKIDSIYFVPGDLVHDGDTILKLNQDLLNLKYEQQLEEMKLLENKQHQLELSMNQNLINLETDYEIKILTIKATESKLIQVERLHEIGAALTSNVDQVNLQLEISRIELSQLKHQIDNQAEIYQADLLEVELQIQIIESKIKEQKRLLDLAAAKTNWNGVLSWIKDDVGSTVNAGEIIARISNLETFKVEGKISDIHSQNIFKNMSVIVKISDKNLSGRIHSIEPIINNGIITFSVELNDKSFGGLRSNQKVDIMVITSEKNNVVRVKNGPFINGQGRSYAFVIEDNMAVRRDIIVGAVNLDWLEIIQGIEVGEAVIISDMDEYKHHEELKIKNDN
jgi:HlyD family secretion protein